MECSLFYKVKVKHKTLHICILCLHLPTAGTAGLYRSTGSSCPALWPLLLLLLNFFLCCVLPIVKSYWCWRVPGLRLGLQLSLTGLLASIFAQLRLFLTLQPGNLVGACTTASCLLEPCTAPHSPGTTLM